MNIELLTIYTLSADGTSYARFLVDGAPVELVDYSYVAERMGATSLTATVRHAKCLDTYWTGREFVVLDEGALVSVGVSSVEKFFLAHTPSSRKSNEDERYEHTLEFRAGRDILLSGVYFCDAVNPSAASAGKPASNSYAVRFVGTLDEFVQRFNDVLAHRGLSGRFSVSLEAGVAGTTESLEIQFDKVTLADALQQAVETWKVPFYFLGDSAVFGSADSMPLVDVEYGADRELLSVSMTNRNAKRVTRISGVGSSENVPYYYPNPSPKGTLGLGGTFAAGAQIADMVKFAQRVGAADTLTYMGDEPSLSLLRVLFGGQVGENAPGGVTAGVEDVTMESGKELPLLVSLNADLSGGFDRRISIHLYANVGCMEQVDPEEPVYYVYAHDPSGSYGGTYKYITRKGRDVAASGWDIVVDRVEVAFGAGAQPLFLQVPYAEEYASRDVAPEDRDLYSAQTLSSVVVDVEEALKLFSNPDTAHCRIYVYAHVASRVKWQKLTGVTGAPFAPAQFLAQRVQATTVFDASGWYNGDEPIGADLSEVGLRVTGTPNEGDTITQVVLGYVTPTGRIMPSIYRDTAGAQRTYDADNTPPPAYAQAYVNPDTGQNYVFEHEYDAREPHEHVEEFDDVKPTIANLQDGQGNALNVLDSVWFDDGYNVRDLLADGQTLKYQYFFVKLKALGFNLFDCAIENGEMALVMSDGPCAGCHFKILVTEDGKNPVQRNANGTLKKEGASGHQKGVIDAGNIQAAQQDTTANAVWVALYLDDQTFGGGEYGTMPAYDKNTDSGPKPAAGDSYTAENILLPQAFFTAAEQELDRRLVRFMWENNADKFDPTVFFSRIYLAENPTVRAGLCDHSRLSLSYAGRTFSPLYVSQLTVNVKEGEPLPEVLVTTKDVVEPRTAGLDERIAAAAEAAVNVVLPGQGGSLSQEDADSRYLRKDREDTSPARPTFQRGINVGDYRAGLGGIGGTIYTNAAGEAVAEVDFLTVRRKATFTQVEVEALRKVSGTILLSLAEATITAVEEVSGGWKCWFKTDAVDGSAISNGFAAGDQAICRTLQGNRDHYYWRLVTEVGTDYIVLSATDADAGSDAPEVGDAVVQLGNRTDAARQCAQVLSCYGEDSPSYVIYAGINSYALAGREISGFVYRESAPGSGVYRPHFFNYGSMLLGDPAGDRVTFTPASGATPGVLEVRGRVIVQGSEGGDVDLSYLTIALQLDEDATVVDGGVILSKAIVLTDAQGNVKAGINGLTTLGDIAAWYGGPMVDHEAVPLASDYAKSLFRFDGSGYLAGGNIHWGADGYGGIPGVTWSRENNQDVITIGGNVRLASVDGDTVTGLLAAIQALPTTYVDFLSNQTITGVKTFTNGIKIGGATLTWVAGTGGAPGYLHIDSALVTEGDQIVIDGEPGGGGGGGVSWLSELMDVKKNLAPSVNDILVWRSNVSRNDGTTAPGWTNMTKSTFLSGYATQTWVTGQINDILSSVLKFQGTTTTAISDGSTTNPITIDGASYTAQKGDVVLYDGKEYLWQGSSWEQLGDESSWALKTTTISAGTGLAGGGSLSSNRTIRLSDASIASLGHADDAYSYFTNGVANSAARLSGNTAYSVWGVEFWSNGVPKSATAQPNLYVGDTKVATSAQTAMNIGGLGNLTLANDKLIRWLSNPAEGETAQAITAISLSSNNNLTIGYGVAVAGYNSYLYGNAIYLRTGTTRINALTLTNDVATMYRTFVPNTNNTKDLGSASLMWRYTYTKRVYLTSSVYLEYVDNSGNGYVHINAPLVTDGDQIVIDGTPGGGGGGSSYLHELLDVYGNPGNVKRGDGTTRQGGDLLGYDSSLGLWVAVDKTTVGVTTAGTVNELNSATPITGKRVWTPAVLADWLAGKNYVTGANAVSNVAIGTGDNAESLAVTKNGTTTYLTIPYATTAKRFKRYVGTDEAGGYDLNTLLSGGGITSQYNGSSRWANRPDSMSFGGVLQINPNTNNTLAMQLAWDVKHTAGETGKIWWRDYNSTSGWGSWHILYDNTTLLLNGVAGGDTALTFYAPTSAGTADQVLLSGGAGVAPRWVNQNTISAGKDGDGNTISSTYLKLSGGTMNGDINLPSGKYISLNANTAMLGLSSGGVFYCGPGYNVSSKFLLGTGDIDLSHRKYTGASAYTDYKIFDASNANLSTIDWTAKDLTAAGALSVTGAASVNKLTIASTAGEAHIAFSRASLNYITTPASGTLGIVTGGKNPGIANSTAIFTDTEVRPGANATYSLGTGSYCWEGIYGRYLELKKAGGASLVFRGTTTLNNQVHTILFKGGTDNDSNGFKIETVPATSYGRQSLGFYTSDVSSGSAPYTPDWKRSLYISYNGDVYVGASDHANKFTAYGTATIGTATAATGATLTVDGVIASTGDQVIASDERIKRNFKPIELSVEQIASCRAVSFDWAAGGHSFGSVAQDWEPILPEAVKQGDIKTLAYGQLALVAAINIAKHETEQDKEIRQLRKRVADLENEVKRLRAN